MKSLGALTGHELYKLNRLGERIHEGLTCQANLICDPDRANDEGAPEEYFTEYFPCRTDRLDAVHAMIEYLEISGWEVSLRS
jgi:hypothetical protein